MMVYEEGKYKYAWRVGPGIRECCLNHGLAQAAWWWEVTQRFKDLSMGIEDRPGLSESLLQEQLLIEDLLETVVPRPSPQDRREYEKFRRIHKNPRKVRLKLPSFVAILGIKWPCSEEALKLAWKQLALKHHPDRGGNQEEFIRIKQAYDVACQSLAD
jgi:hypothetical protein